MRPLVSTDWLASRLGDAGLRVADVRWYLDPTRRGSDAYRAGVSIRSTFCGAGGSAVVPVLVAASTRRRTRDVERAARCCATNPPYEKPSTSTAG